MILRKRYPPRMEEEKPGEFPKTGVLHLVVTSHRP
jgi:hypothetical protein